MTAYIDAHAHLDRYDPELPEILEEIEANGIFTVSVSMTPDGYLRNKAIQEQSDLVLATFGVHPWDAPRFRDSLDALNGFIDSSPLLGEIGLDYHFVTDPEKLAAQKEVFKYIAARGISQNKILNIHSKGAETDVNAILGNLGATRVILHWYSGPMDNLRKLVEKGFYVTVGVEVLSSPNIQGIAKGIPADLLLTETDNPGGRRWLTGETAKPTIIRSVIAKISELRSWTFEETKARIADNFIRLAADDEWARKVPK